MRVEVRSITVEFLHVLKMQLTRRQCRRQASGTVFP